MFSRLKRTRRWNGGSKLYKRRRVPFRRSSTKKVYKKKSFKYRKSGYRYKKNKYRNTYVSSNGDYVRYVYKVTIKNTYVLGAGEASHQVQPDIYKLYQGTSLFGSQDPELNWHFNNFDKYRIDWMEQLCVPTCRFPPNNGYGPLVNSNYYLDTQPEIMVNKSFDGPLRPDEGIMTWDEFSRAKDTFYVSPFKAFKVAMKPRMLCGIGQWSGGSATTAATFKFIGARPYDGWLDTTDLTYNLADKLPHQVGGWIIKTRPNGLHADIAFLCYNKLVISFKGRKKPTA